MALAALPAGGPAFARVVENEGAWTTVSASGPLSGGWLAQAESVSRFSGRFSRLQQQELVFGVGRKAGRVASLYGGYGLVVDPIDRGRDRVEHRLYQQLSLAFPGAHRSALAVRIRLEERFVRGSGDMGLRLRQQMRYVHPLAGKLSAFGTAETFFNLNRTDWGARAGFDRWRLGGGLRHPIGKKWNVELGYLNQLTHRRTAPDGMDHILTTSLLLSF